MITYSTYMSKNVEYSNWASLTHTRTILIFLVLNLYLWIKHAWVSSHLFVCFETLVPLQRTERGGREGERGGDMDQNIFVDPLLLLLLYSAQTLGGSNHRLGAFFSLEKHNFSHSFVSYYILVWSQSFNWISSKHFIGRFCSYYWWAGVWIWGHHQHQISL